MRRQRRFSVSIPHVAIVITVNEHPQKFYQTGFWNSKHRPDTTIPGADFFRSDDCRAYPFRYFSVRK
jgi:hypothetical protein